MSEKDFWLWIVMAFGPSNPRIWKIIKHFETPQNAYEHLKMFDFNLSENEKSHIYNTHLEQAQNLFEIYAKQNINILTYDSEKYPACLKEIVNPPAVLFTLGELNINEQNPAIAFVGARECSKYSVEVTAELALQLSKLGFTIVSGFARGIDFAAHYAIANLDKPTVAVLGSGLDIDYPAEHANFKYFIREKGGAVITEYFLGTKAYSSYFPVRNRIISGLSKGVVVIEAKKGSGSLLTADFAIEQNRDLFCIPPADILTGKYSGVVKYLRDGAIPVYSYIDIAKEYIQDLEESFQLPDKVNEKTKSVNNKTNNYKENIADNVKLVKTKKETRTEIDYSLFDEETKAVLKLIEHNTITMNDIAGSLDMSIVDLMLILDELIEKKIIKELPVKRYEIV
ncbi:MAG: DNA-processing protein DprA [Oscillospiraceae bacterium]|jgi:DNA processing protein|nr:DNA-processing protein DprA [Oscillospiraceae bacterium]